MPGLDEAPSAATNASPALTATAGPPAVVAVEALLVEALLMEEFLADVPFSGVTADADADTGCDNAVSEEVGGLVCAELPADEQPEPTAKATTIPAASRILLIERMIFNTTPLMESP